MTDTNASNVLTVRGVCHCKANAFTITSYNRAKTLSCSCSICTVDALKWLVPAPQTFHWDRRGATTVYNFGNHKIDFELCAVCGCHVCAGDKGKENTGVFGLNVS